MHLYKFRSLNGDKRDINSGIDSDFRRNKLILENDKFWCSRFSELNDPMEGVFSIESRGDESDHKTIQKIFEKKNMYKICSFSNEEAFTNPAMWGYYANGFKGLAIKIEVEKEVKKIKYVKSIPDLYDFTDDRKTDTGKIKKIFTTKSKFWKHEAEYRFLIESEENNQEIGSITAVYFGNPYGAVENRPKIYEENTVLTNYDELKNGLIDIALNLGIDCYSIKIKEGKVVPGKKMIANRKSA